ncbi:MAG: aldose 1-epimerase family protein [Planctomycetaceae bacterium]
MMRNACVLAVVMCLPKSVPAQTYRSLITSVTDNRRTETAEIKSRVVTPDCPVKWSVRKLTLHGGKQQGVELVVIDNGKIRITVVPTRGMGILHVSLDALRLGWDSPVKEVVHPQFVNLESRGGLGWVEGFNEWLCRCGLESNGHPGPDTFINNVGDEATMNLTLHGKIANIPAREVEVVVDQRPPYRIRLRGRVDERLLFGPKLELHTEISTVPGSSEFQLRDVVVNAGAQDQEFQMLYHANYGRPLLEQGAQLIAPASRVTPFNAHAAAGVKTYGVYKAPTTGFVERVYLMKLFADKDQRTQIVLRNRAGDQGVSMAWSVSQLPYLTVWKNTGAVQDGYVTGLEPGTNYPNNRSVERRFGRVPKLKPGAKYEMAIIFGLLQGPQAVQGAVSRVRAVRDGRETQVDDQPQSATE